MRRALIATVLACSAALATAATPDPATPDGAILKPIQALRDNNLTALFTALPPTEQATARQAWSDAKTKPNAEEDKELDQQLALINAPDAVDQMLAMVKPQLQSMDPQQAGMLLAMGGGMVAMQLSRDPQLAPAGRFAQQLITDLSAWLPTSGLNDEGRARQAIEHVVAAGRSFKVKTAAELHALPFDEALTRGGTALKELKQAFAVYDLHPDTALGSATVAKVDGTGAQRTATVRFTAFGHPYDLPVMLKQVEGRWTLDADEYQAAAMKVQGAMGGMGGSGGEPGPGAGPAPRGGPAAPPATP